ncbi:MAG: SipW-dependent-type signal peptide-containing protein, partial [Methanosarcinales archaeon]|nr:SipW-dependent-type signal peptide-containing protein [Methanosarcinales archaeon]
FAAFSDTETSTDNTFTAGTLDLELSGAMPMTVGDVFPGASGSETVTLNNTGSIDAASSTINVANIVDDDNTLTEPEEADGDTLVEGELSSEITVEITVDGVSVYNGLLSSATAINAGGLVAGGSVAGGSVDMVVAWSVDTNAGNEIQSDSTTFDIEVTLNQ